MPTTNVTLAWAVQVPIATFGAHLEAYAKLRPVIDTLRLCNRFGKGEKATVAKLPVEMVQEIEDYLMEEERASQLPIWEKKLRCWEGKCEPIDHLSEARIVEIFDDLNEDEESMPDEDDDDEIAYEGCCGSHCRRRQEPTVYSQYVHDFVDEELKIRYNEGNLHDGYWRNEHDASVENWFTKVGPPTSRQRGRIGKLSDMLLRDFGLEAWVSHGHVTEDTGDYSNNMILGTTLVYLHMPEVYSVRQWWCLDMINIETDPERVDTEVGYAHDVTMPTQPSGKSLGRFDRAMKILDLEPCQPRKSLTSIINEEEGKKSDEQTDEQDQGHDQKKEDDRRKGDDHKKGDEKSVNPKLKMFVVDQVVAEDW